MTTLNILALFVIVIMILKNSSDNYLEVTSRDVWAELAVV